MRRRPAKARKPSQATSGPGGDYSGYPIDEIPPDDLPVCGTSLRMTSHTRQNGRQTPLQAGMIVAHPDLVTSGGVQTALRAQARR